MSEKTALIIGAGVGGLTTAYWLNGIGWQTLVIERAEDLRSGGYMLGLSGAGYDVARRMGILDQLHAGSRPVRENSYRDDSGREVLRLRYGDFLAGLDWVTLPRNTLVESLRGTLGEGTEIRFGTTLTAAIDQGDAVEATLSDGSTLRCDLLIGADGVHSATRQLLFGAEEKYASHLGYRFAAFQVENILGLGEDFVSYVAPGRTVEFYTLSNGRLATLYAWRSVATGQVPAAERRELLRTAFADAHPDALRIIDQLPADEGMAFDELTLIEMPRWRKGRFLLLGDAAHCLTLISGQGAAMAMTSACLLAEELGKSESTIDAALDRHEERLRPTIAGLQQRSRKTAAWFIPASRWGFRLRNLVMRIAPKRFLTSYFQKAIRSEIALAVIDRTDTP